MSGFGVTPEGLRAVRDPLVLAFADVASTRGSWDSATWEFRGAFATAECDQAFSEFQQHLFESLGSRWDLLAGQPGTHASHSVSHGG